MPPPAPFLIDESLRIVERRYRLPPLADPSACSPQADPPTAIAVAIEQARRQMERGEAPDAALERLFIEALARTIRQALREECGDPAFQAMVLRHRAVQVREYASLSAHADRDRRQVLAAVDRIAHPAKQRRMASDTLRKALGRLHALASCAAWPELHDAAQDLFGRSEAVIGPEAESGPALRRGVAELAGHPALARLLRLDALAADDLVRRYQGLWRRNGPASGSATAIAQGTASQRRGAAVEAAAAQAFEALARRLNGAGAGRAPYRVVTSMRVPGSMPGRAERAKSEWDVVLLRRADAGTDAAADPDAGMDAHADAAEAQWDVRLLAEAKASVDAAATDLPRLLRGLRLLACADEDTVYPFQTRQGTVRLRGASLAALKTDADSLARSVLYCCDAPAEAEPRLLGAAGRMQLLSARASLEFAGALADGGQADPRDLSPLWGRLLTAAEWKGVLHQYPMLRQARGLMVHIDDWSAAIEGAAAGPVVC